MNDFSITTVQIDRIKKLLKQCAAHAEQQTDRHLNFTVYADLLSSADADCSMITVIIGSDGLEDAFNSPQIPNKQLYMVTRNYVQTVIEDAVRQFCALN